MAAPDHLHRGLVCLGAGVREEDPAIGRGARRAEQAEQPLGQRDLALVQEQVGRVRDAVHLAGDRLGDGRVRVPERTHRYAGDQVGVFPAVGVPDQAALAASQGHRRGTVVPHQRTGEAVLQLLGVVPGAVAHSVVPFISVARCVAGAESGSTMAPMPESVKISSRMACGSRPSSTWARGIPPRTASRHASIFGILPSLSPGSIASRRPAVSWLITSPAAVPAVSALPGQSAYRPATSVSTISFAASSATATAAAAVSALTL